MIERTWRGWLARILDESEAHQLPALVTEWATATDERAWLARALRLDLALLTVRPELAVPCLVRRFARVGTEHEAAFYARRPAVPALLASASRVVEHFAAAWPAPRPWLRSLRPPPLPLDAGAVEEYRTEVDGPLALDDAHVAIVGTLAWDRGTGRAVPPALVAATVPAREWDVGDAGGDRWGRLTLVERATGRSVVITHDRSEILRGALPLGDGLVLANGDDLDMEDFHCVIDARAGTILWRGAGACTAIAVHGDRIGMIVDERFELRLARSGARLASWYCGPASGLALSSTGVVATRHGAVIRVWDGAAAAAWDAFQPLSTNTWTAAAFSPDGTRLLTSSLLCDARTGEPIARLPINGPRGWLEGGPPRDAQRLVDNVVVEALPWGISAWSSDDGRELVDRAGDGVGTSDHVAFDPRGELVAMFVEHAQRLRLFDLRVMDVVLDRPWQLGSPRLGFDVDGTVLLVESGSDRYVVQRRDGSFADPEIRRARQLPWEPPPPALGAPGGVLEHASTAALPCDEPHVVVSPDGSRFATRHLHYALESAASIVVSLDDD